MDSGKSKKKKILFISDITFAHTIGGTEVATARLLNGLTEDGTYEIYLFSGAPKDGKRSIKPDSRIHITEFPLYPAPGDKGFNNFVIAHPFQVSKLIKKIAPDIIHVHNPSIFSLLSIRVARKYGIPLVYTNHIFAEHFVPFIKTWKQKQSRKIVDWFFQKYMGLFDGIVYPSQIQRESILSKYHLKNTSVVISNGFLPFGEDIEVQKPEWWEGKTVFFTVSRLSVEKNIPIVIDAFEELWRQYPETLLVIVWDGVVYDDCVEYACTKDSHLSIIFVGEKRGEELAKYYKMWDVFISASSKESEGLTTLEAVSFWKPVILADAQENAARQFVQSNGLLFLDSDSNDLTQKMTQYIIHPALIETHGKKSLQIRESYRFSYSLEKYKDFYKIYLLKK